MKHFRIKKPVKMKNDPATQWADFYEDGYHFEKRLELVPISKVDYDNWNPGRYQFYIDAFAKGRAASPIDLYYDGSRYSLGDGNHRVAASVHYGYTHVPAIVTHKVEEQPKGNPPKDLYEEVYGREMLSLLSTLRSRVRVPDVYLNWGDVTSGGYWFTLEDERNYSEVMYTATVTVSGDNRELEIVGTSPGDRWRWRGDKKGLEKAYKKFTDKNIEKDRRVARIAGNVVAARTIPLDKAGIKKYSKFLADKINKNMRGPEHEPIGDFLINSWMSGIKTVMGEDKNDVIILVESSPSRARSLVTGGAIGKVNGKDAIVVRLNASANRTFFKLEKFERELERVLLHEISHLADKFEKVKYMRPNRTTIPEEGELDPKEYYNEPTEVRAYMQEVVYDVRRQWPSLYKRHGQKKAMKYSLKMSEAWEQIEPYLTRRNKNKILGAVWNEIQDLMEQPEARAARTAASVSKVRKLTEPYDAIRGLECDGMTRVLHTVLEHNRIPHKVMGGSVEMGDQFFEPHFWIELSGGVVVDYRIQMWFGRSAPHGIFNPKSKGIVYDGRPVGFSVLKDFMFDMLTEGIGMTTASVTDREARISGNIVAGLMIPPPKTADEIYRWAGALVAARNAPVIKKYIVHLMEMREWALDPRHLGETDDQGNVVTIDQEQVTKLEKSIEKEKGNLAKALRDAKKFPGVKVGQWKRVSRKFKIDITGWKYKSRLDKADPRLVDIANETFGTITVELVDGDIQGNAQAYWKPKRKLIRVSIGSRLRGSIEHELVHWAQAYLNVALGVEDFGQPSKKIRDPLITQWTKGNDAKLLKKKGILKDDFHSLHDIEFYTKLADSVRVMDENIPKDREARDKYFRAFVGLSDDGYVRPFFKTLKQHSRGKWQKAVKELAKAML